MTSDNRTCIKILLTLAIAFYGLWVWDARACGGYNPGDSEQDADDLTDYPLSEIKTCYHNWCKR